MPSKKNRISVSNVRAALKREYERGMSSIVQQLATLGYNALRFAYSKRGFNHRTKNLYESYASAVFVDGNLVENSMRFITNNAASKPYGGKKGHQWAVDYFKSQHPRDKVTVLCVAAMPYAEYLEEGTHRGGYHIQVISAATDYLEMNKNKIDWGIFGGYKYARVVGGDSQYGRV